MAFWLAVLAVYGMSIGQSKWRVVLKEVGRKAKDHQPASMALLATAIGSEPWLAGTDLELPKGALRVRVSDVASVPELAASNEQYRLRLLYGAELRADIHWAIHLGVAAPAEVRRLAVCSQSAATIILQDIAIARSSITAAKAG